MCERTLSVTLLAALLLLPCCTTKQTPYIPEETPTENPRVGTRDETPPEDPACDSSLDLPAESLFKGYPGERKEVPFSIAGGSGDEMVSVEGEGSPGLSFDPSSGEGTVSFSFPEPPGDSIRVTVTLTEGEKSLRYAIMGTSYLFMVSAGDVSLPGERGSRAALSLVLETDIPDCELRFEPSEGFFKVEDGHVVSLEDNDSPGPRTGLLRIGESTGHFEGITVTVTQEAVPPVPKPGMVAFSEWPFKTAMLEAADRDGDGEVSPGEALEVTELVALSMGIRDLTGLEAFRNVWKVDLRGNDIEDATVLRELPLLHWLDLRGNPRLRTFDVTGCSQWFEHCGFDLREGLLYYTFRQQVGVTSLSDPRSLHSCHVVDTRESSDWSFHKKVSLVSAHSKEMTLQTHPWITGPEAGENRCQERMVPSIVFSGLGYLDVDFHDGTWEREISRAIELFFQDSPLEGYRDYFDIYTVSYVVGSRNKYYFPETLFYTPERLQAASVQDADERDLFRFCYEALYGDSTGAFAGEYDFPYEMPSARFPPQMVVTLDCNPYKSIPMPFIPIYVREPMYFGNTDYRCVQFTAQHTTHSKIGALPDGTEQEDYYDREERFAETLEDLFGKENPDKGELHMKFLRYCSIVE